MSLPTFPSASLGLRHARFGVSEILFAAQLASLQDQAEHQVDYERVRLLIMGGSQGSKALNDGLPPAIANMDLEQRAGIEVVHQCGRQGDVEAITAHYQEAGVEAEVVEFMTNMSAPCLGRPLCLSKWSHDGDRDGNRW